MPYHFFDRDGEPVKIQGYAAVFDRDSAPGHGGLPADWTRRVRSGAFASAIATGFISCLINHQGSLWPVAKTKNGTLKLWEDRMGLAFEISYVEVTPRHKSLLEEIANGDASCSWYAPVISETDDRVNRIRYEDRVSLLNEITICAWGRQGAYEDTGVWLSNFRRYDLPRRVGNLKLCWENGRHLGQMLADGNREKHERLVAAGPRIGQSTRVT